MGLRLLHLHLHGLFRSQELELGRDSDTGGQTLYVLELARSLALRPEVDHVDVVTRQIVDRRVSPDYALSEEPICLGARILRLPFGPKRYLRKELLWPHLEQLADQLVSRLSQPGGGCGLDPCALRRCWSRWCISESEDRDSFGVHRSFVGPRKTATFA